MRQTTPLWGLVFLTAIGCEPSFERFVPDDGRMELLFDDSALDVGEVRSGTVCAYRSDGRQVAPETRGFVTIQGGGRVDSSTGDSDSDSDTSNAFPLDTGTIELVFNAGCAPLTVTADEPGDMELRGVSAAVRSEIVTINVVDRPTSLGLVAAPTELTEAGTVNASIVVLYANGEAVPDSFVEVTFEPELEPSVPQYYRTDADGEAAWTFSANVSTTMTVVLVDVPTVGDAVAITVEETNP